MKPYGEMLTLPLEFASITGAWIETALAMTFAATVSSRPSRARGLKLILYLIINISLFASITGAWIETKQTPDWYVEPLFASITGAWIETTPCAPRNEPEYSRPSRARGLKHNHYSIISV
ncbi:hypothetical protein [Psychrobacter sp. DD43]|uniref:hypothetical protein n=1 Tax=Psychrobacter sp. DD43 TaxID=2774128 RepID=UPI0039B726E8